LWLLKLVFPSDKRPTWIEFGYHPGHLWVLAITVRTTDGKYYALDKDGRRDLGEPEQKVVLEPRLYEDVFLSSLSRRFTADTKVQVGGVEIGVVAECCEPEGVRIKTLGFELDWPLWTHYHGNTLSVTIRVPPGHLLRDATPTPHDRGLEELRDRLRSELIDAVVDLLASLMPMIVPDVILDPYTGKWYEVPEEDKEKIRHDLEELYTSTLRDAINAINVTANTALGDAFAALTLVAVYDQLASRIAEKLGVHVYRAVPAYVTVLTAWLADLRALSEYLQDEISQRLQKRLQKRTQVRVISPYAVSTFTQFITYQPTLGLEVYGPPLEARAVNAVSFTLAYLSSICTGAKLP
ncbi:MAG: hypothetical protein ABGW50_05775, partial [Thermococcus sp.]